MSATSTFASQPRCKKAPLTRQFLLRKLPEYEELRGDTKVLQLEAERQVSSEQAKLNP
jgi:hypothetical protein